MVKVVKFGGTSMSTAETIKQCASIVRADKTRKFIVVSAPGKRNSADKKVTDLLYACYHDVDVDGDCKENFAKIRQRFSGIVKDLGLTFDIKPYLDEVEKGIIKYRNAEYCASRGEYLSAIIMSKVLRCEFVDAKDIIKFNDDGEFDAEYTNDLAKKALSSLPMAVIPGFYGSNSSEVIKTFSRGGSDVSGSVIARAVSAGLYENWTDVDGFLTADPRIVENPKGISTLSYRELRELSYMGANVLHPEAIFPVKFSNIPINIKNTFKPEVGGTMIVPTIEAADIKSIITGIAGKKDYTIIYIEKSMMNNELGFARRVLSVLEYFNISFEHMPSGIDTLSIVISDNEISGKEDVVLDRIKKTVNPDQIEVIKGFSLIATVGHGMSYKQGTAARLFAGLAKASVNVRMIDQGSSELNIIVGVATQDYERAINAIYKEFFA